MLQIAFSFQLVLLLTFSCMKRLNGLQKWWDFPAWVTWYYYTLDLFCSSGLETPIRLCTGPNCPLLWSISLNRHAWYPASKNLLNDLAFFFCSNASIALARSLCKYLLAVLITASEADTVAGFMDSWCQAVWCHSTKKTRRNKKQNHTLVERSGKSHKGVGRKKTLCLGLNKRETENVPRVCLCCLIQVVPLLFNRLCGRQGAADAGTGCSALHFFFPSFAFSALARS